MSNYMHQKHVLNRTWSSHAATNTKRSIPSTMNRKSYCDDFDLEKKRRAASESSQSLHDPHKDITQINNNLLKLIISPSITCINICSICFDSKTGPDMFRIGNCNHRFCTDCMSKHAAAKIQQHIVKVKCPNPECYAEVEPENLESVLPEEVLVQWKSLIYEYSIDWWKKIYCPLENCSGFLVNDGKKVVTRAECPSCHGLFCAKCKVPWHEGKNCKEIKMKRWKVEKDLNKKFLDLAKKKMWKKCPKCTLYVERHGGCEHMNCRCGCDFCYHCGKDWRFGHTCKEFRTIFYSRLHKCRKLMRQIWRKI